MLTRDPFRLFAGDRRFVGPITIVGAWTLVAMAAAVQAVALVRLDGRADLMSAVLNRLSILPLWALATPFILRSARRFGVVGENRQIAPVSVVAHLVLGTLFIVLSNVVIRVPGAFAADGRGGDALLRSTMQGVAEYYPPALVVYGVIVAIGHFLFRSPASLAQPPARPAPASPTSQPVAENDVAPRVVTEPAPAAAVAAIDGHITVRQWNRVHLVRVEDIDFVEAEDNYVVVHAASRAYKGRDRISDVESQLDARRFVRIHRSTIVHIAKIREVQPLTHGDHAVILRDGKVLRVARSRRQALGEALGLEL
jgi:two-component system LytT family response regulator